MERALICGWFDPVTRDSQIETLLAETEALVRTAGGDPVGPIWQRKAPDRRTLIGTGKVEEIRQRLAQNPFDLVVFCGPLHPVQNRNLEEALGIRVIDRTRLILDIFAGRARSLEGKLQVELAQLLYLLPRLTGKGVAMSRLGGGIGTRGPGESKLESDRRVIKKKIAQIKEKLEKVTRDRELQRRNRRRTPIPVVSLVGYTSAGKSTLFSALTGSKAVASASLFSTLDPLLRRIDLAEFGPGYACLLSDTVGFIREMPKELFTSFRATLEETVQADLVLHVVDLSSPEAGEQRHQVEDVLRQLEIPPDRIVTVYNKVDTQPDGEQMPAQGNADTLYVSAREGWGLDVVRRVLFERHFADYRTFSLDLSIDRYSPDALARWAIVVSKEYVGNRVHLTVLGPEQAMRDYELHRGGDQ